MQETPRSKHPYAVRFFWSDPNLRARLLGLWVRPDGADWLLSQDRTKPFRVLVACAHGDYNLTICPGNGQNPSE